MGHDEHQSCGAFYSLDEIGNRLDVFGEMYIRQVFLVDVGGIDDLGQLLALKLTRSSVSLKKQGLMIMPLPTSSSNTQQGKCFSKLSECLVTLLPTIRAMAEPLSYLCHEKAYHLK